MSWKGFHSPARWGSRLILSCFQPQRAVLPSDLIVLQGKGPAHLCQIFSHIRLGCALTKPPVSPAQEGRRTCSHPHSRGARPVHPVPGTQRCWAARGRGCLAFRFLSSPHFVNLLSPCRQWGAKAQYMRVGLCRPGQRGHGEKPAVLVKGLHLLVLHAALTHNQEAACWPTKRGISANGVMGSLCQAWLCLACITSLV